MAASDRMAPARRDLGRGARNGGAGPHGRRRNRLGGGIVAAGLIALFPVAGRASCSLASPGANFGVFTGAAVNPGPTPIYVNCPLLTTYQIAINAGQHSGGTTYNWNVQNGNDSSLLHYQVFRDSAKTQPWGGTVNADTVNGIGTGSTQTVYAYTTVPASAAATPGTYTDTITVTLWSSDGNPYYLSLSVVTVVLASCTLSASPLAFGIYTGLAATASTALAVTCTNTTTYTVGADNGLYPAGGAYQRRMTGPGGAFLAYSLSRNSSGSMPWGTTAGTDTSAGTGNGNAQSINAYGAITAGQYVKPGAYSDSLTFTVNYGPGRAGGGGGGGGGARSAWARPGGRPNSAPIINRYLEFVNTC